MLLHKALGSVKLYIFVNHLINTYVKKVRPVFIYLVICLGL
jgi:hypothetical protein